MNQNNSQLGKYKIAYLILLSSGLFFIHNWLLLLTILFLQSFLWSYSSLKIKPLFKAIIKLKWFLLVILIAYTFFSPFEQSQATTLEFYLFSLDIYYSGLSVALLMMSRIFLMIMASLWVRKSCQQAEFVIGLKFFKIPEAAAIVIDLTLNQLTSEKKTKDKKRQKKKITFKEFKTNKLQFFNKLIQKNTEKSQLALQHHYPELSKQRRHDILVILSVVAAIMSLKFLQMMPGLPIAPGHKNLLILPLIMLASLSTSMKYGGLIAGFTAGVVSFMMGFGKFGIFEILHFAFPGLISDWLSPMLRHKQGKFLMIKLVLIGALLGLARFIANFAILLMVGAPKLALIVMTPMLISQIVFGALSSLTCIVVVNKHHNGGWFK